MIVAGVDYSTRVDSAAALASRLSHSESVSPSASAANPQACQSAADTLIVRRSPMGFRPRFSALDNFSEIFCFFVMTLLTPFRHDNNMDTSDASQAPNSRGEIEPTNYLETRPCSTRLKFRRTARPMSQIHSAHLAMRTQESWSSSPSIAYGRGGLMRVSIGWSSTTEHHHAASTWLDIESTPFTLHSINYTSQVMVQGFVGGILFC